MAMATPVAIDDKVLIVSCYPPKDSEGSGSSSPKALEIKGEYVPTEPACFRKEGGGKIHWNLGYWYINDRLGQQVAWVAGELGSPNVAVPKNGWQTKGDGFFSSWEEIPITVEFRQAPLEPSQASVQQEQQSGCVGCGGMYRMMKDKLPNHHKDSLEALEDKANEHTDSFKATLNEKTQSARDLHAEHWPVIRDKARKHTQTAKDKLDEFHPVVKQQAKQGYTKCHEFWTHPDTVDTMKKTGNGCLDAVKYCAAGCLTITATLVEKICSSSGPPPRSQLTASESDQAMDATYVKLDSTTPVIVDEPIVLPPVAILPPVPGMNLVETASSSSMANPTVEPTTLPPNRDQTYFLGDGGTTSPVPEDDVVSS